MNRKTGTDAGNRKDEKKEGRDVKHWAGAERPLLHGCISVNACTAADHKEEKTAKECEGRVPSAQHARTRSQVVACVSQEEDRRSFDRDARQGSRSPRTSVDVDSVVPDIRM